MARSSQARSGRWHPHHDIEGITYVVAGHFEHVDSLGNGGVLHSGGVQRMTLGRGTEHSGRNHFQAEPMQSGRLRPSEGGHSLDSMTGSVVTR